MTERLQETPVFVPIDERGDKKRGYKLVMASLEGPNGCGKSSIHHLTLQLVEAAHHLSWSQDGPKPPIVGVAEPLSKFVSVEPFRTDTWRSLGKGQESLDGVLSGEELKEIMLQAEIFLWGRRMVEEEAVYRFPIRQRYIFGQSDPNAYWIEPYWKFNKGRQEVLRYPDLREVGMATLLKDRGTAATIRHQGIDPEKGGLIIDRIKKLYQMGFLRKADMTVCILPHPESTLINNPDRDEKEPDRYSDTNRGEEYNWVRQFSDIFTKRWVTLYNDPTGKKNSITMPSMMVAMLAIAAEQEARGQLMIKEGEKFKIPFCLGRLTRLMEDSFEYPSWQPSLSHSFNLVSVELDSRERNIDSRLIDGSTGETYLYVNGDMGITAVDKKDNWVEMVIKKDLAKDVK